MADLKAVRSQARTVSHLESKLETERRALEAVIAEANDAGTSYTELAGVLGLSKARVGEMAKAARAGVAPYELRRDRG